MAACCYLGADLGDLLDHNFPSRLTDGTPHSYSDLLYFTPFLPFTLLDQIILSPILLRFSLRTKYFLVKILLHFAFPRQKILSLTPNPQKHSQSHSLSDLEKIPLFCLPISYSCHWSLNSVH